MPELTSNDADVKTLSDPWERTGAIPLDGVLERNRYHPVLVALFALVIGMAGYMVIGNVAMIVLLVMKGISLETMLQDLEGVIAAEAGIMLGGNAIGLFLGLGLVALVLARFNSSKPWAYLRLRKPDPISLVLALFGLIALIPVVQWAGIVNEMIPLPDSFQAWEDVQMELLEKVLQGDLNVIFSLFAVALTPALCEEFFFRGYLQRKLERGLGIVAGIIVIGFVFGMFHLRPSQFLPLSLLGVYLAYLTWRTGSLWIPVVIHFANNAIAVATAEFVKNSPDLNITDVEEMAVPWYLGVVGLIVFVGIVYVLHGRIRTQLADHPAVSVDTHVP